MYGAFASIDELWQGTLEYIWKFGKTHVGRGWGSKPVTTKEILGPILRLINPNANMLTHVGRMASPIYAAGEFMWYMSGRGSGPQISYYAPSYKRFIESDGKAHGGYGRRWAQNNQLTSIIELLRKKPDTRQAVLSVWRADLDLAPTISGSKKDIPCTLSLQFLLRDGELNCIGTMRSNDLWLGLPYDIFCFTTLQHFIAKALGVTIGWYQHQPGSLHLYERNFDEAEAAISIGASPLNFHFEDDEFFMEHLPEAKRIEEELRHLNVINPGCFSLIQKKFGAGSRWGFLLALCVLNSSEELSHESLEAANSLIPEIPLAMAIHLRKVRAEKAAEKIGDRQHG